MSTQNNHLKYDWKSAYLAALRLVPIYSHAAKAAGIATHTAILLRKKDEEFRAAEQLAFDEGVDRAEREAYKRAVEGVEEPVIHGGRLQYRTKRVVDADGNEKFVPVLDTDGQPVPLTVNRTSDALLQFYLRGRRKTVYADRTELTGADGGPIDARLDDSTRTARVAQLMALAAKRKEEQASRKAADKTIDGVNPYLIDSDSEPLDDATGI